MCKFKSCWGSGKVEYAVSLVQTTYRKIATREKTVAISRQRSASLSLSRSNSRKLSAGTSP